jgi:hypothetical protein
MIQDKCGYGRGASAFQGEPDLIERLMRQKPQSPPENPVVQSGKRFRRANLPPLGSDSIYKFPVSDAPTPPGIIDNSQTANLEMIVCDLVLLPASGLHYRRRRSAPPVNPAGGVERGLPFLQGHS